jgi:hypothetical protein
LENKKKEDKKMTKQETWNKLVKLKVVSGDMPKTRWNLNGKILAGLDLTGTNFSNTNFWQTNLSGANLTDANLENSDFSYANLIDVNFTNANLWQANFNCANLTNSNLTGANLEGANLTKANMENTNLKEAHIDLASWPLWCGSINVVVDDHILKQIGYHWIVLMTPDKIKELGLEKAVEFVNGYHKIRSKRCPKIKTVEPVVNRALETAYYSIGEIKVGEIDILGTLHFDIY